MTLPDGWRQETLGQIAEGGLFSDGDWVESKNQDPSGNVRLTQLADIGVGSWRDRSNRWMSEDQASRLRCTFLQPRDVLIARMPDPIGRSCLVPERIGPAVTVVDVALLRVRRRDVEPRFVMWAMNSPSIRVAVEAKQSGTTRKRISRKSLVSIKISLPPLDEQRHVVEILEEHLSSLQAVEINCRHAVRRSESLLKTSLWRATHLAGNPTRLADFADVRLGRQRSPSNHVGENMVPYLRAANVDWNVLRLQDVKEMHFAEKEVQTYQLLRGDILLTEASGSASEVGKSAIYPGSESGPICFQNTLLRVRVADHSADYVQRWLLAEALVGGFRPESRGVGINHLGRARLAKTQIHLPDADGQARALRICDDALAAREDINAAVAKIQERNKALRNALLQAAFSGKLTGRASDLNRAEEAIAS